MQRIVPMKDSATFIFVVDVYDTLITFIYFFNFFNHIRTPSFFHYNNWIPLTSFFLCLIQYLHVNPAALFYCGLYYNRL